MDRRSQDKLIQDAARTFLGLPRKYQIALVVLVLVGVAVWFVATHLPRSSSTAPPAAAGTNPDGSGEYLFCFWNVENLFDDRDDKRRPVDEEFDNPFAHDADLRAEKYDHIASALLRLNGGKGPDVIACVEVESPRAAELLKDTLNRQLDEAKADPGLKYTQVAMIDLDAGRHIAPCVITRLALDPDRTRLHGRLLRVLETHVVVNGHDLCLVASHWTSQLRQKDGSEGGGGRERYAQIIYDAFLRVVRKDPKADFLLCGDFNDTPDAEPVTRTLHATWDRVSVTPDADPPLLLDLLARKDPKEYGTHWYNGKPLIYDHVCVSAGLLDTQGWSCDPDSVRVPTGGLTHPGATRREPWRFGSPRNPPRGGRGYSDHFPVTVTLKVAP